MNRRRALADVCAALRGHAEPDADWLSLIELANQALVTPAVHRALEASGALADVPQEAAAFMADVAARNAERNRRLWAMAMDAVAALNAAGIEPTLLKGMAVWAVSGEADFDRMMSDVDLLVRPDEVERAIAALQAAGFGLLGRYEGAEVHVAAELGRPSDVGLIDLHQRAPGPPGMAEVFDPRRDTIPTPWAGQAHVPTPAHQVYLLCLHDQFHDGDYWRGGFDLRHLQDIAGLARGGVDWAALEALIPTRLVRNAVHGQLLAAHRLLGAEVPPAPLRRLTPGLQHRRRLAQHLYPRWRFLLAGVGLLMESGNILQHRSVNRTGRRTVFGTASVNRPKREHYVARIRQIMSPGAGKI